MLAIFSVVSLLWVQYDIQFSITRMRTLVLLVFLYIFTVQALRSNNDDNLYSFILGAFIVGNIILVIQFFTIYDDNLLFMIAERNRYGGEINNLNAFGKSLALSSIICLYYITDRKNKLYYVLYFITLFIILTTKSKSSLLIFIIGTVLYLYLFYSKKKIIIYPLLTILIYLIVSTIIANINSFGDTFYRFINVSENMSTLTRLEFNREGLSLFTSAPFFGHGIGSSNSLNTMGSYYHNNFIQMLVELGVLGFMFYYIWLLFITIQLWKLRANAFANLLFVIMFVLLVADLTNTTYYHKINYLWYSIGMLYVIQNNKNYAL